VPCGKKKFIRTQTSRAQRGTGDGGRVGEGGKVFRTKTPGFLSHREIFKKKKKEKAFWKGTIDSDQSRGMKYQEERKGRKTGR